MTRWIAFDYHGFHVQPQALPAFVRWMLARPGNLRQRLGMMRGLRLSTDAAGQLETVQNVARQAGLEARIIRLPRGTTRLQAFDLEAGRVLHLATSNPASVARELAWRDGAAAGLAPGILWRDETIGAWTEPLLKPVRTPTPDDILVVLAGLTRDFYQEQQTTFEAWVAGLLHPQTPGIIADALQMLGATALPVPVSRIHGDVNPGNIYPLADGRVLVGDWEYARNALATYDLWVAARFWPTLPFATLLARFRGMDAARHADWLEIAHRIEWYTTLQALTPDRAQGLMAQLRDELEQRLRQGFRR